MVFSACVCCGSSTEHLQTFLAFQTTVHGKVRSTYLEQSVMWVYSQNSLSRNMFLSGLGRVLLVVLRKKTPKKSY